MNGLLALLLQLWLASQQAEQDTKEKALIERLAPVEAPEPAWGCYDELCFDPNHSFRQTGFETGLEA